MGRVSLTGTLSGRHAASCSGELKIGRDAVLFPVAVAPWVRPLAAADLRRRPARLALARFAPLFCLFERALGRGCQHRLLGLWGHWEGVMPLAIVVNLIHIA